MTSRPSPRSRFVILGCGHTGTTLISGLLHLNGFWGCRVNAHFEPIDIKPYFDPWFSREEGSFQDEGRERLRLFFERLDQQSHGHWTVKYPRLSDVPGILPDCCLQPYSVIFNFRHPANTISHLLSYREKELSAADNLAWCEGVYCRRNRRVLDFLRRHEGIPRLMVHYDDLVERRMDNTVARFVGRRLDFSLIDPRRRRAQPIPVSDDVMSLYEEMLAIASRPVASVSLADLPAQVFGDRLIGLVSWRLRYRGLRLYWEIRTRVTRMMRRPVAL